MINDKKLREASQFKSWGEKKKKKKKKEKEKRTPSTNKNIVNIHPNHLPLT